MRLVNVLHAALISCVATAASAQTPAAITVTSPTIKANETIPIDHTGEGKDVSPALAWSGAPASTKQFAVIMDDPDVQFGGGAFVHWVVYKIPATAKGLPADIPREAVIASVPGAVHGRSGFRQTFYRGPMPPPGKPHHYTFTVYALDTELELAEGATRAELVKAMEGHIIGQGSLVAIYERKPK